MSYESSVIILAVALLGAAGGYLLRILVSLGRKGSMELEVKRRLLNAKEEAKRIVADAEERAHTTIENAKSEAREREESLKRSEERVRQREEFLDKRQADLDAEEERIKQSQDQLAKREHALANREEEKRQELERISGLRRDEARAELYDTLREEHAADMMVRTQKLERVGTEKLEERAQAILATAIQRMANSVAPELMTTTVHLPSDEVKGKIIGKEGRNIRAFEAASGVELIIDDTPGTITLSSFDPVRRQVARYALEELIKDGRIQPARIEEELQRAQEQINNIIKEKGEEAVYECGVYDLDPRIVSILGRLHFRTSYGQNILQHSIEMAHIAGMIAEELGANATVARTAALVHDIGKALDHEIAGSHVEIGRRILMKFGADEEVITAMQAHHEEYPYESIEAVIVQTADAISGARPGARRDSVENFLNRLTELETVANAFSGVERAYALQAGREVRVFVEPEQLSDFQARELAREIALRIENELQYPGEIKVNVIRESRTVAFAR